MFDLLVDVIERFTGGEAADADGDVPGVDVTGFDAIRPTEFHDVPDGVGEYDISSNSSINVRWRGDSDAVECAWTRDGWETRLRRRGSVYVVSRGLDMKEAFAVAGEVMERRLAAGEPRSTGGAVGDEAEDEVDASPEIERQVEEVLDEFDAAGSIDAVESAFDGV
ncbi:MAG: hypothetical protein ACLFMT_06535 [Halobacteriales archaeon]